MLFSEKEREEIIKKCSKHKCFGTNRCWNNVKAKCDVYDFCLMVYTSTKPKTQAL